jgi:acyl-homoserine lactone acylase PvdQ
MTLFISGALVVILLEIALINSLYYRSDSFSPVGEVGLASLQDTTYVFSAGMDTYEITANSKEDMYFASGYLAARDDLFHLTIMSAAARGELTRIFGETAAPADLYVRYLQIPDIAEKTVIYLNRELKGEIDNYCAGINAGIEEYKGSFPADFRTRGIVPKLWEIRDAVGAFLLVNSRISENIFLELLAESINNYYGQEKLREMVLQGAENRSFSNLGRHLAEPKDLLMMQQAFYELTGFSMANTTTINWVVSGEKTKSGKPLLIASRSSEIGHYGRWKTMTAENRTSRITGVFLAGFPLPFTGTNGSVAWSMSPTGYSRDNLLSQLLRTGRGSESLKERNGSQEEEFLALACAGTLNGLWSAANAGNLSEFLAASSNTRMVDSRYVLADTGNNIALVDNTTDLINPENGNIVGEIRALDKIMPRSIGMPSNSIGGQTARIQSKLDSSETITIETIEKLLHDPISTYAQEVAEHLVKTLLSWDELPPRQHETANLLDTWSGNESSESQAALIFEMFLLKFAERTFSDEMNLINEDLFRIFLGLPTVVYKTVYTALTSQTFSWYDDVSTIDRKESKEEIIQAAFRDAIAEIEQRVGINPYTWSWGSVHRSSRIPTAGSREIWRKKSQGRDNKISVDGSWTTTVRSPYFLTEPFTLIDQATYYCLLDLGESEGLMRITENTGTGRSDIDSVPTRKYEKFVKPQNELKNKLMLVPENP